MAPTEIAVMMQSQIAKLWVYPPSILFYKGDGKIYRWRMLMDIDIKRITQHESASPYFLQQDGTQV